MSRNLIIDLSTQVPVPPTIAACDSVWGVGVADVSTVTTPPDQNLILAGASWTYNGDGTKILSWIYGVSVTTSIITPKKDLNWGNFDGSTRIDHNRPPGAPVSPDSAWGVRNILVATYDDGCRGNAFYLYWSNLYNPRIQMQSGLEGQQLGQRQIQSTTTLGKFITQISMHYSGSGGSSNGLGTPSTMNAASLKITIDTSGFPQDRLFADVVNCANWNYVRTGNKPEDNRTGSFTITKMSASEVAGLAIYSDWVDSDKNLIAYRVTENGFDVQYIYGNTYIGPTVPNGIVQNNIIAYSTKNLSGNLDLPITSSRIFYNSATQSYTLTDYYSDVNDICIYTITADPSCAITGCTSSTDCTDPRLPYCDVAQSKCVQCLENPDCKDIRKQCINDACVVNTPCSSDINCSDPVPYCDLANSICVQCLNTTECPASFFCDQNNQCKPNTNTCTDSSECPLDEQCVNGICQPPTPPKKSNKMIIYIIIGVVVILIIAIIIFLLKRKK